MKLDLETEIRYPEGESAGDQVEITDWLCDGWVMRTATEEK